MTPPESRRERWLRQLFGDDSATANAVRAAQVAVLARGTPTMALGNLFNGALTLVVFWGHLPLEWVGGWYATIVLAALHRLLLWWRNRRRLHHGRVRRRTLLRSVLWSGLMGAFWGIGGLIPALASTPMAQGQLNFLAFVIGGQAAAAATWLAPVLPAYLAYLIASVGPLLFALMMLGTVPTVVMALMLAGFVAVLSHFSVQACRTFRSRVLQGLERDDLIAALRGAHQDMERQVRERTAALQASNAELSAQVAERERAERALLDQQALLSSVIEGIPMRISVKDRDGNRLIGNRMMREAFGIGETDPLPPADTLPLVPSDEQGRIFAMQARVLEGEVLHYERRRRQPDGSEEWIEVHSAPVRNPAGEIIGLVAVTADITARKSWERELASFFDLAQDIHLIASLEGRFHRANHAFEDILRISPADLPEGRFLHLIHPDDRPNHLAAFKRLAAGDVVLDQELRVRRADGVYRWLSWRAEYDLETGLVYAVGRDVTDTREVHENLRANQRLLQAVFDSVPTLLWVKSADGRYLMVNRAMARFFKREPADFPGRTVDEFTADPEWAERFESKDREVLARGEPAQEAADAVLNNGRRVRMDIVRVPLKDESGTVTGVVGTAEDTTERARLEAQLRQAQKMEAVGQLAGGVAHEFNNLLQVILGHSQIALSRLDDPDSVRESLRQISQSAEGASGITRRLLAFSRRETLQPRVLEIGTAVTELYEMMRRLIPETIELELDAQADATVEVDPGQLQQALINLCLNARDAMPQGGTMRLRTELRTLDAPHPVFQGTVPAGRYVCLEVSDNGAGMPQAVLERIFEPFYTTKTLGHGTGLGLSMVYGFVQESGGYLEVRSALGAGSTFTLFLPLSEASPLQTAPDRPAPAPGAGQCLLVAEDEDAVRRLLVALLESEGYEVLEARDGEEAITLFEAHAERIAMAVLDVVMPKRSGRDVFEAIVSRRPDLPVLFSTGYSDRHLEDELLRERRVPLISKPYSPEDLLNAVQAGLGNPT